MEVKALTVRDDMTLKDTLTLGETLARSGFFSDTKDAAQAVVKILAGRELGFGPIASMTGVHIIQGKVAIGAALMGASVKADPRYDYRVIELSDQRAEIAFFEGGKELGRSVFTMDDAKAAGLTGKDNWRKFPRNMLYARAMSNGVRWYCPDAFGGNPAYTPDELGAEVDDEGNVVEGTVLRTSEIPSPKSDGDDKRHWIDDPKVRARFWQWTQNELGLSDPQVYEALGVDKIHLFTGSMSDAKAKILGWIDAQTTMAQAVAATPQEAAGE
jgi:hypothetical protein